MATSAPRGPDPNLGLFVCPYAIISSSTFISTAKKKKREEMNDLEDKQRIEQQLVTTHHQNSPFYPLTDDGIYFPVEHTQLRGLLGDVLTILDTMNLNDRAHYASKAALTQAVWRWWDNVADNATTSSWGCIAPIVMANQIGSGAASNRWGWKSEDEYIDSITPKTAPPRQQ